MNRTLQLLLAGGAARAFGISLIGPFLFLYLHNVLGTPYLTVGLLFTLLSIPGLVAVTVGGLLADRIGRRRVYVISLGGEALGLLAVVVEMREASFAGVVLAFAAAGTLGALGGPALSAFIADLTVGAERTQGFSWFRVSWNAGFASGVAAAGVLIALVGFVPAAALSAAVVGGNAVVIAVFLHPSPYDLARSAAVPVTVPLPEPLLLGSAPASAPDTAPTAPRSVRESLAVVARDRIFLLFSLASGLTFLVEVQWAIALPLFVQSELGLSYAFFGAGLALNGLLVVFGQTATTHAVQGRRHTSILAVGLLLYVAGFLALAFVPAHAAILPAAFLLVVVVLTIGENLSALPTAVLPSNLAPTSEVGNYNGAYFVFIGIGQMVAGALAGVVLSTVTSGPTLWLLLVSPAVPAVLLLERLGRRIPADQNRV